MISKKYLNIFITLLLFATLLGACAPKVTEVPVAPKVTEAPVAEETTVAAPTDLHIMAIFESPLEQPWCDTLNRDMKKVIAEKPHGLNITWDYTESVSMADAERVLRDMAESGKYNVIWAHSGYSDAIKLIKDEYPNIAWIYSGPGNTFLGGGDNTYWYMVHVHESGYLLGVTAGLLTKTNIVGSVAAYPYSDPNDVLNGFVDGAKATNPDVKVKISYIEAWFDPPKAKEATYGMIAAGADVIFAERYGVSQACEEKGVYALGQYIDQYDLAPKVTVTGTLLFWTPYINYIIDEWWTHATTGNPYNSPKEAVWFTMAQGATDIAPFHDFEQKLPKEVIDQIMKTKQDILDGKLVVPLKIEPAPTD
jgi:basic membrane lipoprotein Med (substrate-binding protein (PBP1-ABC) superfamily)